MTPDPDCDGMCVNGYVTTDRETGEVAPCDHELHGLHVASAESTTRLIAMLHDERREHVEERDKLIAENRRMRETIVKAARIIERMVMRRADAMECEKVGKSEGQGRSPLPF